MKKVIYTTIIKDGADKSLKIKEPTMITKGWDYVAFVDDRRLTSKHWKIIYVDRNKKYNARKQSRLYKILNDKYLPDYDVSIYVDSRFNVKCDLNKFLKKYLPDNYDIAMMHSPKRQCIYAELNHCKIHTSCPKEDLVNQYNKYREEGVPENLGLMRCGLIIRRHSIDNQIGFMEEWLQELLNESERDTPSFAYTLWKHPLNINILPTKKVYNMFR